MTVETVFSVGPRGQARRVMLDTLAELSRRRACELADGNPAGSWERLEADAMRALNPPRLDTHLHDLAVEKSRTARRPARWRQQQAIERVTA